MTSDLILGTPFLTQIYPFYVNEIGLHTSIMEKTISFKFLTAAKQREIASLQSASIYKQINTITPLQEKVLQHIIHHVKQRVQTLPASVNLHPHAFALSLPGCQQNMSTNKKEIVAIVFVIVKFQNNLFSKRFLFRLSLTNKLSQILLAHPPQMITLSDLRNIFFSQVANLHRPQLLFVVLCKNHSVGIILLLMIYANHKNSMS